MSDVSMSPSVSTPAIAASTKLPVPPPKGSKGPSVKAPKPKKAPVVRNEADVDREARKGTPAKSKLIPAKDALSNTEIGSLIAEGSLVKIDDDVPGFLLVKNRADALTPDQNIKRVTLVQPKAENGDSKAVKAAIGNGHKIKKIPTGKTAKMLKNDRQTTPMRTAAAPKRKAKAVKKAKGTRTGSKNAMIADMLKRKSGCTTAEVRAACDWPSVSMPQQAEAAGIKLRKEKVKGQPTRYFAA